MSAASASPVAICASLPRALVSGHCCPANAKPRREDWSARVLAAIAGDDCEYPRLLADVARLARKIASRQIERRNYPATLVDDVVQETLVAVHLKLPEWDPARPLETWVIAVARNKAIDAMRDARKYKLAPLDDHTELAAPALESRIDVSRLIGRLSPRGRQIVEAIALRAETVADVAARFAMSPGAVRVALHRAIRAMARVN